MIMMMEGERRERDREKVGKKHICPCPPKWFENECIVL